MNKTRMLNIELKEANIPAHLDIEQDIQKRKNGLLTFTLRINRGEISDYNLVQYVNAQKYFGSGVTAEFQLSVKRNAESEPALPHDTGERGNGDTLWNDNS